MARLEAQYRALFYPTPPDEVQRIADSLVAHAGDQLRILDPCAGEGDAIQAVAAHLRDFRDARVHLYAAELSYERHRRHVSKWNTQRGWYDCTVLDADWHNLRVSNDAFSLLWNNPPYDWGDDERQENSKKRARQEYLFLRDTMPKLQIDGVLIYIIPEKMLTSALLRAFLATHLRQLSLWRFMPANYEAFSQIVVMGVRREPGPSPDQEEMLAQLAKDGVLDYEDAKRYSYAVKPYTKPTVIFTRSEMPDDDLIAWVENNGGVHDTLPFTEYMTPPETDFTPLVAPRTGHAATLLASGMMGTLRIDTRLIKGQTTKAVIYYDENGLPLPSNKHNEARKSVTTFSSEITALDLQSGQFETFNEPDQLQRLFTEHAKPLTEAIFERYKPLYDGHINGQGPMLDALIPYKKLPGQKKAGLLPLQKQLAVAAETACRKYGVAIIVGEMGLGKSAVGLATGQVLNAYPMLVLTPAHLVAKWLRECKDVIPDSNPVALRTIGDVNAFFNEYSDSACKGIAVLSKEPAKRGPGWTQQKFAKVRKVVTKTYSAQTGLTTTETRYPHLLTCPRCGASVPTKKLGATTCYFCEEKRYMGRGRDPVVCGEALYQYGKLTQQQVEKRQKAWAQRNTLPKQQLKDALTTGHTWPLSRYIKSRNLKFGILLADELHQYKGKSTDQGRAFHNLVRQAKYTVGLTGTLFGGKASDLYFMLYRMFPRSFRREGYKFNAESDFIQRYGRMETTYRAPDEKDRKSGATTGMSREPVATREIPGISPGIYRHVLPFAIFAKIDDLGIAMPKFIEKIERIPMNPYQRLQYDKATDLLMAHIRAGFSSFDSASMHEAHALMGAYLQMAINRPNAAFRSEEQWWRPFEGESRKPYFVHLGTMPAMPTSDAQADDCTETLAVDLDEDDTIAGVSAQFSQEPDADEQPAPVRTQQHESENPLAPPPPPGMEPLVYDPAVLFGELLPKEKWLIDTVTAQKQRNRRCIVYVSQTKTRDIQPRLQKVLEANGIHAVILPDGNAAKREQWIHDNPSDVLITNPRKVETGLDLVMFQSIIFYEMTYSLFVFWQALRRVWRLGQTKSVEVHYAVYKESMEEQALALMGHKMKAAHLLYGDSAETAVSAAVDGQDIMAELAANILNEQHIDTDGITGLVKEIGGASGELDDELTDYSEESEDATIPAAEAVIEATYTVGEAAEATAAAAEQPLLIEDGTEFTVSGWYVTVIAIDTQRGMVTVNRVSPAGDMQTNRIALNEDGCTYYYGKPLRVQLSAEAAPQSAAAPQDADWPLPVVYAPAAQQTPAEGQKTALPKPLRVGHIFSTRGQDWVLIKPRLVKGKPAPTARLVSDKNKVWAWASADHFEMDTGLTLALDWTLEGAHGPGTLPEPAPRPKQQTSHVLNRLKPKDIFDLWAQKNSASLAQGKIILIFHEGFWQTWGGHAQVLNDLTKVCAYKPQSEGVRPPAAYASVTIDNIDIAIEALRRAGHTVSLYEVTLFRAGIHTLPALSYLQGYEPEPGTAMPPECEPVKLLPEPKPAAVVATEPAPKKSAPSMAELFAKFGRQK